MASFQLQEYQHSIRQLTEEERSKLECDSTHVSDFKKNKLEKEAERNWDLFYKRNSTNFFKDRHWTCREFQELCSEEGKKQFTEFQFTVSVHKVSLYCICSLFLQIISESKMLFVF